MNNSITLKESVDGVLKCHQENGHPGSYLIDLERTYSRLLAHNLCIRFLKSYLKTGNVSGNKFHEPVGEAISDEFAKALILYNQAEEASRLSQGSLIKNHRSGIFRSI